MLGIGKRSAAVVALAASLALALSVLLQASPAKADVGPRPWGGNAGTGVKCDLLNHTLEIEPTVTMDYKYGNLDYSQMVAAYVSVYSYATGRWYPQGWKTAVVGGGGGLYTTSPTYKFHFYPEVPTGREFVWVWYGWYTTSGWQYLDEPIYRYGQWDQTHWFGYISNTCYV